MILLVCRYCGAEYPLASGVETCPKCGGPVARKVVMRSLAGKDVFAMDVPEAEEAPPAGTS